MYFTTTNLSLQGLNFLSLDDNGLQRFPVEVLEGLIYVRLHENEGASFRVIADNMGKFFRLHGLDKARIAERRSYRVNGNWKLAVENYLECYHCLPTRSIVGWKHSQ